MPTYSKPEATLNACGGVKLMSELEPKESVVFIRMVSIVVQFSPFNPQAPKCFNVPV